jgi:hypothetical protein
LMTDNRSSKVDTGRVEADAGQVMTETGALSAEDCAAETLTESSTVDTGRLTVGARQVVVQPRSPRVGPRRGRTFPDPVSADDGETRAGTRPRRADARAVFVGPGPLTTEIGPLIVDIRPGATQTGRPAFLIDRMRTGFCPVAHEARAGSVVIGRASVDGDAARALLDQVSVGRGRSTFDVRRVPAHGGRVSTSSRSVCAFGCRTCVISAQASVGADRATVLRGESLLGRASGSPV